MKCQICNHPNLNWRDICPSCGWENEQFLVDQSNPNKPEDVRVEFQLFDNQWDNYFSYTNGYSPKKYLDKWIENGKISLLNKKFWNKKDNG